MKEMARRLRTQGNRLRVQLFLAYFVLLLLFFGVALAALVFIRGLLIDQIGTSRLDVLRQIAERASIVKTSSITLSNLYEYELEAPGGLATAKNPLEARQAGALLNEQKSKYDTVFGHLGIGNQVIFLNQNGYDYASEGPVDAKGLQNQLWYRRLLQTLTPDAKGEVQFSRAFASAVQGQTVYQFAAGRLMGQGGVLLVLIDEQRLQDLYAPALGQGGEIYIYDQDGFIVSHTNKKMLGKQFIDVNYMHQVYGVNQSSLIQKLGQSVLLSTYLDEDTGWTIVEEIPTAAIFGPLNQAYLLLGLVCGAGVLAAVAVAVYMSGRVARPLAELSDAMDAFGCTDFTPLTGKTGTWEIDHLRQSFNHMAGEILALMDDIRARSRQKRLLEMSFLRAQINPHFLYNTLFSIRCLVEIGKNEQAAEMLTAFTSLLKMTLSVESSVITLADEFESTRKYLVLQQIRYGDTVGFELDLAPETADFYVPPLILQPVVENAIFHGLEAKKTGGTIVVCSALEQGQLVVTISDDGVGMSEAKLEQLRQSCGQPPQAKQRSIGLANVHSRLRLNGGEGVSIESAEGIGTTVTLRLAAWATPPESEVISE